MFTVRAADTAFLDLTSNREIDPFKYAVETLIWLYHENRREDGPAWARTINAEYISAIKILLQYFDVGGDLKPAHALDGLKEHLANWRNNIDPAAHPLAELGRIVRGDPGAFLEYRGPIFTTTVEEVFEGITHEVILGEWKSSDEGSEILLLTLATIAVSTVAQTCYWAAKGQGTNLAVELERVFRLAGDRGAMRGQLANLVLAGTALMWGNPVEFVQEVAAQTPDWVMGVSGRRLWVECTSFNGSADEANDITQIRKAVAEAWSAKKSKFSLTTAPGLISTDLSRILVGRQMQTAILKDHVLQKSMHLPNGMTANVSIYDMKRDFDHMAQESLNRDLHAVLASAVRSRHAQGNGIRGFLVYFGQQLVVNSLTKSVVAPRRGLLVWAGDTSDPELEYAIQLCYPNPHPSALAGNPRTFLV